jgi:hypothetical protein
MDLRCRSTYITKRSIDQLIHTEKEKRKDEPVDRRSRGGKDKLLVMQDPLDHVRLQLFELLHRYLERSRRFGEERAEIKSATYVPLLDVSFIPLVVSLRGTVVDSALEVLEGWKEVIGDASHQFSMRRTSVVIEML